MVKLLKMLVRQELCAVFRDLPTRMVKPAAVEPRARLWRLIQQWEQMAKLIGEMMFGLARLSLRTGSNRLR
jgi:hypothetical protein